MNFMHDTIENIEACEEIIRIFREKKISVSQSYAILNYVKNKIVQDTIVGEPVKNEQEKVICQKIKMKGSRKFRKKIRKLEKEMKQLNRALERSVELKEAIQGAEEEKVPKEVEVIVAIQSKSAMSGNTMSKVIEKINSQMAEAGMRPNLKIIFK